MWIHTDSEDPRQALPFVDITIGEREVRALLDSGAGRTTVLPPEDAVVEDRPPEGTGVFGGQGERRVWDTTVSVGGHSVGPIELDTRQADEGRDLLGQDVLSQFRCEYRFADSLVRINGIMPDQTYPIFLDRGNHIYLELIWPNVTANAVLDTGASLSVVDAAFANAHPDLFIDDGNSSGTDSAGTTNDTPMVQMEGPNILGQTFTSTLAAIVDLGPVNQTIERRMDLIIGWPILRQANWAIDHPQRLAGFTP